MWPWQVCWEAPGASQPEVEEPLTDCQRARMAFLNLFLTKKAGNSSWDKMRFLFWRLGKLKGVQDFCKAGKAKFKMFRTHFLKILGAKHSNTHLQSQLLRRLNQEYYLSLGVQIQSGQHSETQTPYKTQNQSQSS
jgi:hypothetical protein